MRCSAALKGSAASRPSALAAVAPAIEGLQRNLTALDGLVASRLEVAERKDQLLRRLSGTNIATQRLVAPGVLVMDSKLAEYRRAIGDAGVDEQTRRAAAGDLADEMTAFMPQQKAQIELSAINDTLLKAAGAETPADLPLLAFPLRRSLATLEALANEFDAKLRPRLLERVEEFRGFTDGPESILGAREEELAIVGQAQGLLAENVVLSRQVGDALDRLVGATKQDIGAANQEALAAQRWGSGVVIGMVLLSLLELRPDRVAVRRSQPDRAPDRAVRQHAGDRRRQPEGAAAGRGRRRDRAHGRGAHRVPRHRGRGPGEEPA